jgi:hypothetical protein
MCQSLCNITRMTNTVRLDVSTIHGLGIDLKRRSLQWRHEAFRKSLGILVSIL